MVVRSYLETVVYQQRDVPGHYRGEVEFYILYLLRDKIASHVVQTYVETTLKTPWNPSMIYVVRSNEQEDFPCSCA